MFYAVYLCGNPNHRRYGKPLGFILEGEDDLPLERKTKREIEKELKDAAGWVTIIEIKNDLTMSIFDTSVL